MTRTGTAVELLKGAGSVALLLAALVSAGIVAFLGSRTLARGRYYRCEFRSQYASGFAQVASDADTFSLDMQRIPHFHDKHNWLLYTDFSHRVAVSMALLYNRGGASARFRRVSNEDMRNAVLGFKSANPGQYATLYYRYKRMVDPKERPVQKAHAGIGPFSLLFIGGVASAFAFAAAGGYLTVSSSLLLFGAALAALFGYGFAFHMKHPIQAVRLTFADPDNVKSLVSMLLSQGSSSSGWPRVPVGPGKITFLADLHDRIGIHSALASFDPAVYTRFEVAPSPDEVFDALMPFAESGRFDKLPRKYKALADRLPAEKRDRLYAVTLVGSRTKKRGDGP